MLGSTTRRATRANADYFTEDDAVRAEILEDRDEYISENVFWVPEESRWPSLLAAASLPDIGERIDKAFLERLRGSQRHRDAPARARGLRPAYVEHPLPDVATLEAVQLGGPRPRHDEARDLSLSR